MPLFFFFSVGNCSSWFNMPAVLALLRDSLSSVNTVAAQLCWLQVRPQPHYPSPLSFCSARLFTLMFPTLSICLRRKF